MSVWWVRVGLFGLCVGAFAQGIPARPDDEFVLAVREGERAAAADAELQRLRELVRAAEVAGVYQDGELEALETLLGIQEPEEEPPSPPPVRYADE